MKKFLFRKFFVALIVCGFTVNGLFAQEQKSFQVTVIVEKLAIPAKIILTVREIGQWAEYSAESTNGKFIISGKVQEPSFAYIVMKYGHETERPPKLGNINEIFIENMPITLRTKDSLRNATVKAGRMQKELEELNDLTSDLKKTSRSVEWVAKRRDVISNFIRQHPDSFVSLYAIENFALDGSYAMDPHEANPLTGLLSMRMRNTASGKELVKDIKTSERTSLGALAPDFSQADTTGNPVTLKSFRGQYVFIDFWASWCRPCRVDNPLLVKSFKEFSKKNFTIVGVSLDNNKSNWIKAIRKDKLEWTHTSDLKFWKNEVALLYGVKTVPQNYLISPDGKIIAKNIPAQELASRLKELIK